MVEEAPETDPHWRGSSWAKNRVTPSQEVCPSRKPTPSRLRWDEGEVSSGSCEEGAW